MDSDQPLDVDSEVIRTRRESAVATFRERISGLLKLIMVGDLPPADKPLISIPASTKITEAFAILIENEILAAPVVEETGKYSGFIELQDLAKAVVNIHSTAKTLSSHQELLGEYVSEFSRLGGLGSHHPNHHHQQHHDHLSVWTPSYVAKVHPIKAVEETATLLEVCDILARGTKRVAVVDQHGHITRIISQSWLIDAVSDIMESMDQQLGAVPVSFLTLHSIGIAPKDVIACDENKVMVEAFKLMENYRLSGIPIIDSDHHLVGQATPELLRFFLASRDVKLLETPVRDLPRVCDNTQHLTITIHSTVRDAIAKFSESKSHRLFLVDDNDRVVGVCSLKDFLFAMLK